MKKFFALLSLLLLSLAATKASAQSKTMFEYPVAPTHAHRLRAAATIVPLTFGIISTSTNHSLLKPTAHFNPHLLTIFKS